MEPDRQTRELTVTSLHPGITKTQIQKATEWAVRFEENLTETRAPEAVELEALRALRARTSEAHGTM